MSTKSRILVLVASVLLVAAYFFPLWSVHLYAPQYPEGLGMEIWMRKVTGYSEFDLKNINLLNHYIGMASIDQDSVPEFRYMGLVLLYMIFGALVTVLIRRNFLLLIGLLNLVLVGAAGLYDFWLWEYKYGHNLDPNAAIQIPGMTYQPPILGCKQLLNITACSWPSPGAFLLAGAGALVFLAILIETKKILKCAPLVCLLLITAACSPPKPEDFKSGERQCDSCNMTIVDMRFKAEAVTKKRKLFYFDSIECLKHWQKERQNDLAQTWLTDFYHPSIWIPKDKAFILKSEKLASPMGGFLSAYASKEDFERAQKDFFGTRLSLE